MLSYSLAGPCSRSTIKSHESTGDVADDVTYIILGLHKFDGPLPNTYVAIQSEQTGSKWFTEGKLYRRRSGLLPAVPVQKLDRQLALNLVLGCRVGNYTQNIDHTGSLPL